MAQVVERGEVAVDVEQARLEGSVVLRPGDAEEVVRAAILRSGIGIRIEIGQFATRDGSFVFGAAKTSRFMHDMANILNYSYRY